MQREVDQRDRSISGNMDLSDSSMSSSNESKHEGIKTCLLKVVEESRRGNQLSRRILKRVR